MRPRSAGIQIGKVLAGEKHAPLVYFALMGVQQVKIGTSTNLRARMASFYRSLDDVVLAVPGGEPEEAAFHEAFARCRVDPARPELFWISGPLMQFLNQHAPRWHQRRKTGELTVADCEAEIRRVVYHGAPLAKLATAARYLAWLNLENARDWIEGAEAHRDGALSGGWWYELAYDIGSGDSRRIIRQLWLREERDRLIEQLGYRRRWAAVHAAVTAAVAELES